MLSLFTSRINARPVIVLRRAIGVICILRAVVEWQMILRVFKPGNMRFPVLEPLLPITREHALVLVLIWLVSAITFTFGWKVRLSGFILAGAMGASLFLDQQLYSSHVYLLALEVLLLAIANPSFGLPTVIYWPILLLKIQLSLVYLFAALSKINASYLSGIMIGPNLRSGLLFGPLTLRVFAVSSIIVEVFLAVAFWSSRLRKVAVVIGVLFHIAMVSMLTPVAAAQLAVFAIACLAIYPLYFVQPDENRSLYPTNAA